MSERQAHQAWCPTRLKVRSARIVLESLEVQADIGFHDFEVGTPAAAPGQRRDLARRCDAAGRRRSDRAWNYDFLRTEVEEIAVVAAIQSSGNACARRLRAARCLPRSSRASGPDFEAGRLSGRPRRRSRDRFFFVGCGPTIEQTLQAKGFHAFRLWNKIRCATFEPDIRKRACRR